VTTVVNIHRAGKCDVRIGRPSKWGNPFSHLPKSAAKFRCAGREEAMQRYREWVYAPEQAGLRAAARRELRGKVLGCYCKPLACHGDVLAEIADSEAGPTSENEASGPPRPKECP